MKLFNLKFIISLILLCSMVVSLCACGVPYIDQEFVDLNNERPTTAPTEDVTEPELPPTIESQPSATTPPETKPSTDKKPGGFVLDETAPPTEPTQPSEPTQEPNTPNEGPDETRPVNPNQSVSLSVGIKKALLYLGGTTNMNITAYNLTKQEDGGVNIVHIVNASNSATQKSYVYYESTAAYNEAKLSHPADACNDSLQLILISTTNVLPVTNPETLALVLFGGYTLWR